MPKNLTYSRCIKETQEVHIQRRLAHQKLDNELHQSVNDMIQSIRDYRDYNMEGKTAFEIGKHILKLSRRSYSNDDFARWRECLTEVAEALSVCKRYNKAVEDFKLPTTNVSLSLQDLKRLNDEKNASINKLYDRAQKIDGAASTKDKILGGLMITLAAALLTFGTLALIASIPAIALGPLAFMGCPLLLLGGGAACMLGSVLALNACGLFFTSGQHGLSKQVDKLANILHEKTNLALSA